MWIRSQDKLRLFLNPKLNIENFYYDKFSVVDVSDDSNFILGIYESKERAIEVLNEIQTCISNFFEYEVMPPQNNDWFFSVQAVPCKNKVYNMPEE